MREIPCIVCNEQPSKYKCPRCTIQYCSLPCWKTHKTQCDSEIRDDVPLNPPERLELPQNPASLDFTGLNQLPEFRHLLARYPNLKSQLKSIWEASLEPTEDSSPPSHRGGRGFRDQYRPRNRDPWTPEQGAQNSTALLRLLRESDGGVQEFVDLINLKYGPNSSLESPKETSMTTT